jgi:hypothetical protein
MGSGPVGTAIGNQWARGRLPDAFGLAKLLEAMSAADEKELHRLSKMLETLDKQLPASSPIHEGLIHLGDSVRPCHVRTRSLPARASIVNRRWANPVLRLSAHPGAERQGCRRFREMRLKLGAAHASEKPV